MERKKCYLILIFFFLYYTTYSQVFLDWAKRIGNNKHESSEALITDNKGCIYVTGDFNGVVDFDPGAGIYNLTSNGVDGFVAKYDTSGNFVWAKHLSGPGAQTGYAIAVDNIGNVYTTGSFNNKADFDPGADTFYLTATSTSVFDIYISKLDASGNFIWAKSITGQGSDVGYGIVVDNNQNVYTIGKFSNTVDFDPGAGTFNLTSAGSQDVYISKLNQSGNFVWAKQIGGSVLDNSNDIILDANNNVYITGTFKQTVDFDPGASTYTLSAFDQDVFILKLNTSGNFIWAKQFAGNSIATVNSICLDFNNNILISGAFKGTVDFDPNGSINNITSSSSGATDDIYILKLDNAGNLIWVKSIGGMYSDLSYSLCVDQDGNSYTTGTFYATPVDFDPGSNVFNLTPNNQSISDIFLLKLSSNGDFVWATQLIGDVAYNTPKDIDIDLNGNLYLTGIFESMLDMDPSSGYENIYSYTSSFTDIFIAKYNQSNTWGVVFNDIDSNCIYNTNEGGLPNRLVSINSGAWIAETNKSGIWNCDLPNGNYSISVNTINNWQNTCSPTQNFTITNSTNETKVQDLGLLNSNPCPSPKISINMPQINPCFSNRKIFINVCNSPVATGVISNSYVIVELDSLLFPQSSSIAYTAIGNNQYKFNTGNLNIGVCKDLWMSCSLSCNATIGQTLCIKANLFPLDSCVLDTIPNTITGVVPCTMPWDKSSLKVTAACINDSMRFVVYNHGSGDMVCYSPIRIYKDGVLASIDSIMLASGDSAVFVFAGDGRTWRLETEQHPLHPGNSHPNATVENCNPGTWTPGLVNVLPQDDADPVVDIYCGVVTGSYDPNDKTGYPLGVGATHNIIPNQQLEYVVRFQNTGTDTAFTVIIRDTLDTDLDIFSVVSGASSHKYNFRMYGPRVLEWKFYNIMLPDSNVNEPTSHGFVTFTVNQNRNLANGTQITNNASIYFDYNAPVITNTTLHTVNESVQTVVTGIQPTQQSRSGKLLLYPNPATNQLTVYSKEITNMEIYNQLGVLVKNKDLKAGETTIDVSNLPKGLYVCKSGTESIKLVIE